MGIRGAGGLGSSSTVSTSAQVSQAERESNTGMRPPAAKAVKLQKSTGNLKGKNKNNEESMRSVMVIGCGVEFTKDTSRETPCQILVPRQRTTPNKVAIQNSVLKGTGIHDPQKGILLDEGWNHQELSDVLRERFPKPFKYFEAKADETAVEAGNSGRPSKPMWYLASSASRRLSIVPTNEPTGATVKFNRGNAGTGFSLCHVWIVSAEPIPAEVVATWAAPNALDFSKPADDRDSDSSEQDAVLDEVVDVYNDISPSSDHPPAQCINPSKCRLFSHSDDEDSQKRSKGEGRKWSRLPEILSDNVADELNWRYVHSSGSMTGGANNFLSLIGSACIDLTQDEGSTFDRSSVITPAKPTMPRDPAYSLPDLTLPEGDPYASAVDMCFLAGKPARMDKSSSSE
ncbi:hypothetical protein B0H16DRAFT_1779731 [Mycena metata]|uniref:Uncharacterized protein n=1 Tax=Mycena metata TaxID=1033252 RepID=A0AAD7MPR5_9AGAR|nr:hypothetical protein B0H16DRAFT_1779731 [Mycena metata]